MLYPKSAEKKLTQEQFRHPGSEYRGAPFWAWNCRLEKEELLRQPASGGPDDLCEGQPV